MDFRSQLNHKFKYSQTCSSCIIILSLQDFSDSNKFAGLMDDEDES